MKLRAMALMTVIMFLFSTSSPAWAAELVSPAAPSTIEERLQQIITVEYKDADLGSVLRSLALTYHLNLLTGPDIKGKVSINLQEITVEKALEAILKANGLIYSKKDGVIYVSSGDASMVDVVTEVIQLKYLTATQAQNITRKILSAKGDMKINETANNIIVTDYQENLNKIKDLLKQTDTAPKQVLIEAKILDISSTDLKALGVTWNADLQPVSGGLFGRVKTTPEILTGGISMPSKSSSLDPGQIVMDTLTVKGMTLSATIDALVSNGKAHLLASPSIAVINGQEARIVIGKRFPYKERTRTTSGTTETTKFVDIGTTLKVCPQINDDGYITMQLHPEVSSLKNALDAGPEIDTREADTTVRVKEGETLIIGGLISQEDSRTEQKIPVLGSIPFLGALFSRSTKDWKQTELAVFITPRILYSQEERAALGRKQKDIENSYTLIDKSANLSLVEKMFDMAMDMDRGRGIESANKDDAARKAQALSEYELIYKQFPDSERAPEAKYRVGMIQWKFLREYKEAKNTFSMVATDYPRSSWAEEARKAYEEMDQELQEMRLQSDQAMQELEER